jgi:hypothetical protein
MAEVGNVVITKSSDEVALCSLESYFCV